MAMLAALPAWVPVASSIVGGVMGAAGNVQAGEAAEAAGQRQQIEANYAAEQARINSGQALAASQREALEKERQARLVQSRILAVAGASGGGVGDPTVLHLSQLVAGEGALRAATALYGGEEKARMLRMQATGYEYSGNTALQGGIDAKAAYDTKALGSLFGGASSMFSRFGAGGFGAFSNNTSLASGAGMVGGFGDLPGTETALLMMG